MKAEINFVRNRVGQILYRTELRSGKLVVKNRFGRILGYCRNGETRDPSGKLVARGEAPGLLHCMDVKRKSSE